MTAPALQVQVTGVGAVLGDNLNTYQSTCNVLSDLRGFIGVTGIQVYSRGQNAVADRGQGIFYWATNIVGADDNYNIILPYGAPTGSGWLRLGPGGESTLTITVLNGQTSGSVAHGLPTAPVSVEATPQADVGSGNRWWVSAVNSSSITITTANAVGQNVPFYVRAYLS